MPRNNIDLQPCPYNRMVDCDMGQRNHDCTSCGWYPVEEYRRKLEIMQKEVLKNGNQSKRTRT